MSKKLVHNVNTGKSIESEYIPTQEEIDQRLVSQAQTEQEELKEENRVTLQDRAKLSIHLNKDYLNIEAPTTPQSIQQIKELTRQVSGIIRLVVNELNETD